MRLLAASDLHIGRVPSLPEPHPEAHGRAAWEAVAERAVRVRADALLLAGDIVQSEDGFFEAFGALAAGVQRLRAEGIPVFAIAGNHDAGISRKIAREIEGITLLGMDGGWDTARVGGLALTGCSFVVDEREDDPMDRFQAPEGPWLGLLHTHLDGGAGNRYAPVRTEDFERHGGDWVLGHIHRPGPQGRYGRAFYCGSAFALDPTEEGLHGAWLLDFDEGFRLRDRTLVPISPWRFETLAVDLTGAPDLQEAQARIASALGEASRAHQQGFEGSVYYNLRLEGECPHSGRIARKLAEAGLGNLALGDEGCRVRPTGRILDLTRPPLDLASLVREGGPLGTLASLIQRLEAGEPEPPGLEGLLGEMGELYGRYPLVRGESPGTAVLQAAKRLLQALDEQRERRGA